MSMAFRSSIVRRSANFIVNNNNQLSSLLKTKWRVNSFNVQRRYKSINWSYIHGASTTSLIPENLGHFVNLAGDKYGDADAVVNSFQGIRKTYKQFADDINAFAAGLISLQLNIGDRFGIWSPNCYEWLVAQHAASKAGLIGVPINPAFQPAELDYCIRKVGMRALLAYDKFKTQDYHLLLTKLMPEIENTKPGHKIKSKNYPYFDTFISLSNQELPGTFKFEDVLKSSSNNEHRIKLEEIQKDITMDKAIYILFTSGTTGKAKGVMLSHHSVVNYAWTYGFKAGYDKQKSRWCTMVPMFHVIGCLGISLNSFINGNTVVMTGPAYNTGLVLKAIQDEKCNEIAGTTTMYVDLVNHPDAAKTDFTSLRRAIMGGSICPPTLLKHLTDTWKNASVTTGYGLTEVTGGVCASNPNDPLDEKLLTSGRAHPYTEIKIMDLNGNLVPRGQPGEICVRGYKVMMGYWEDEQKTRESITSDGWYRTGDVGIILENGCLQIVDRIKDMIIRGGENIYPKEIEDFLMKHPKILEAYVIGVPDERMGEEVSVWVQCKNGETITDSELREFCKRKLAHFKIPRYVRLVDKFPKTVSGKVQKHVMREIESKRK